MAAAKRREAERFGCEPAESGGGYSPIANVPPNPSPADSSVSPSRQPQQDAHNVYHATQGPPPKYPPRTRTQVRIPSPLNPPTPSTRAQHYQSEIAKLTVVSPLSLSSQRVLALLVLGHLVRLVLAALPAGAEGSAGSGVRSVRDHAKVNNRAVCVRFRSLGALDGSSLSRHMEWAHSHSLFPFFHPTTRFDPVSRIRRRNECSLFDISDPPSADPQDVPICPPEKPMTARSNRDRELQLTWDW